MLVVARTPAIVLSSVARNCPIAAFGPDGRALAGQRRREPGELALQGRQVASDGPNPWPARRHHRLDRSHRGIQQLIEERGGGRQYGRRTDDHQLLQALRAGNHLLDLVQRLADELRELVELIEADRLQDVEQREDAEQLRARNAGEPRVGIEGPGGGRADIARDRAGDPREAAQRQVRGDQPARPVTL